MGTTTPAQKLDVHVGNTPGTVGAINTATTFTNTAANTYIDNQFSTTINLSGNQVGAANFQGTNFTVIAHNDANTYISGSQIRALQLTAEYQGTQTGPDVKSLFLDPENTNTGTVNSMYGALVVARNTNAGAGNINNLYGYYMANPINSGTGAISNAYGLYVENMTTPTQANTYGIYIAGNKSYFGNSIGINTTSPLAGLDARALSATTPVASISGSTNFAGLVVDNSGSGDLFTASSSGLNRFVITQAGNVGYWDNVPRETARQLGRSADPIGHG